MIADEPGDTSPHADGRFQPAPNQAWPRITAGRQLAKIERRVCSSDSLAGDVSVERGGLQAPVTKQHLYSADVCAGFKQMSREAVSKCAQRD